MKGRKRIALLCFLALLLVSLPLLAACGDDDDDKTPKPEEEEIVIGFTLALSGLIASSYGPSFKYILGTFRYINEVLGGIEGFKIRLVWSDWAYDQATAVIVLKRLREQHHPVMWLAYEDFAYTGVLDMLERDMTPVISYSAFTPHLYEPPLGMFFALYGVDSNLFTGAIRWILDDWEASGKTGRPKLGTLHWDNPWGNGHKMAGGYQWAEDRGVDVVERTFPQGALDLRPQLLGLRDAGVDYLWFNAVTSDAVLVIRDAKAVDMWDDVKFIRGYSGEPYDVLEIVGEDAEGLYEVSDMEPRTSGVEAFQVQDTIYKWAEGETRVADFVMTPVLIEILKAVIHQAVVDVGRENINGEALYNAFQTVENVNSLGAFKEVSWGPDRRIANRFMKIKQYTKTDLVAVTDWIPMDDHFGKAFRGVEGWPSAD